VLEEDTITRGPKTPCERLVLWQATLLLVLPSQVAVVASWRRQVAVPSERSLDSAGGWTHLLRGVIRFRTAVLAATVVLLVLGVWGVVQLRSSARIYDQLHPRAKVIQDYDWLERSIGPMVPLEIVLRFPRRSTEDQFRLVDRLRYVTVAHGIVASQQDIGAVVSAASFAPRLYRRGRGAAAVAREANMNRALEEHLDRYVEMGLLRETQVEQLWRISARSYASRELDYADILEGIRQGLAPLLEKFAEQAGGKASVIVCGGVPLVQQTQQQMMIDLKEGFLFAAVLITCMMVALALASSREEFSTLAGTSDGLKLAALRVGAGCVAMVPNLLPCLVVFGVLGWADVAMDIGSMLTASVALGIAVDDTLHFLTWLYRALVAGATRAEAIGRAYQHCGAAMIETTLICGLGLLVFAFSPFMPIARFAWLMFTMLTTALVGDLIILPALLLSPLGKLFDPLRLTTAETTSQKVTLDGENQIAQENQR